MKRISFAILFSLLISLFLPALSACTHNPEESHPEESQTEESSTEASYPEYLSGQSVSYEEKKSQLALSFIMCDEDGKSLAPSCTATVRIVDGKGQTVYENDGIQITEADYVQRANKVTGCMDNVVLLTFDVSEFVPGSTESGLLYLDLRGQFFEFSDEEVFVPAGLPVKVEVNSLGDLKDVYNSYSEKFSFSFSLRNAHNKRVAAACQVQIVIENSWGATVYSETHEITKEMFENGIATVVVPADKITPGGVELGRWFIAVSDGETFSVGRHIGGWVYNLPLKQSEQEDPETAKRVSGVGKMEMTYDSTRDGYVFSFSLVDNRGNLLTVSCDVQIQIVCYDYGTVYSEMYEITKEMYEDGIATVVVPRNRISPGTLIYGYPVVWITDFGYFNLNIDSFYEFTNLPLLSDEPDEKRLTEIGGLEATYKSDEEQYELSFSLLDNQGNLMPASCLVHIYIENSLGESVYAGTHEVIKEMFENGRTVVTVPAIKIRQGGSEKGTAYITVTNLEHDFYLSDYSVSVSNLPLKPAESLPSQPVEELSGEPGRIQLKDGELPLTVGLIKYIQEASQLTKVTITRITYSYRPDEDSVKITIYYTKIYDIEDGYIESEGPTEDFVGTFECQLFDSSGNAFFEDGAYTAHIGPCPTGYEGTVVLEIAGIDLEADYQLEITSVTWNK